MAGFKRHSCVRCGLPVWERDALCNDCIDVEGKTHAHVVWGRKG